jgi:predicted esterase/ribosome-binding protein aMBF1 (putative translation factor)
MPMPICSQRSPATKVAEPQAAVPQAGVPQPGVLVPHETCHAHPDQTYALYLPSNYTPERKWPIIYAFDPGARGERPVELMKGAAERYGYIVAGSNNSRNGSWKVEAEAAQAVSDDSRARLSIDPHRVYFAGFSGGARVAAQIARNCKCAAGVVLNGAGFPIRATPSRDSLFPVFAAVGTIDFNYPEVTRLSEALETAGFPHLLRYFDGPHQWAPVSVMGEALAWLRLVAMKQNLEPRDASFIEQQHAAALSRARSLEQSGDLYAAWREYGQCASTFDQLTDTSALRQAAARLATQKAVRDGAKRERREFEEQENLTNDISAGLAALGQASDTLAATLNETDRKIVNLRESAEHEKHPDKARVLHRAISGILVEALEAGNGRLEAKDIALAKVYFQLAADADPDSVWALSSLATAYALSNDRKGALETLRQARAKSKDPAAFSDWINQEPAFARFRDDPQFRMLLQARENN